MENAGMGLRREIPAVPIKRTLCPAMRIIVGRLGGSRSPGDVRENIPLQHSPITREYVRRRLIYRVLPRHICSNGRWFHLLQQIQVILVHERLSSVVCHAFPSSLLIHRTICQSRLLDTCDQRRPLAPPRERRKVRSIRVERQATSKRVNPEKRVFSRSLQSTTNILMYL